MLEMFSVPFSTELLCNLSFQLFNSTSEPGGASSANYTRLRERSELLVKKVLLPSLPVDSTKPQHVSHISPLN